MAREGTGGGSLLGVRCEERSPDQNVGHLAPDVKVMAAPTDPLTTAASVGAGPLTGTYKWVVCKGRRMGTRGFLTSASPASDDLVLVAKNGEITDIVWGDADFLAFFRSRNDGPYALVFIDWDKVGAAVAFTDTLPETKADYQSNPPVDVFGTAVNQTGTNGGFLFADIVSQKAHPVFSVLDTKKLTGLGVTPETLAGPVKLDFEIKDVFALGYGSLMLASLFSLPTRYQVKTGAFVAYGDAGGFDEPTVKNIYVPVRVNRWQPFSFAMLSFKGAADAVGLYQCMCSELAISVKNGAIADVTAKVMAASFGVVGFPVATLAGGSTYDTVPVIHGAPIGAAAGQAISLKNTSTPAAGQWTLQTGLGDAPTFSDTKTADYDTANPDATLHNRMTRGAARLSDKVQLSTDGIPLGKSGRPVGALYAHDVTTMRANDVFKAPAKHLIPDIGSTPGTADGTYSGFDPVKLKANGYTAAHVTITIGGTLFAFNTCDITLTTQKKVKDPLGPEAMVGVDVIRNGDASVMLKLSRDLLDETFQALMQEHQYAVVNIVLEGDPIEIAPGVFSVYKESIVVASNYGRIKSTTRDVSGPGVVAEPIEIQLEQAFTITEITPSDFPNMGA
jgi:hypothetical protein